MGPAPNFHVALLVAVHLLSALHCRKSTLVAVSIEPILELGDYYTLLRS